MVNEVLKEKHIFGPGRSKHNRKERSPGGKKKKNIVRGRGVGPPLNCGFSDLEMGKTPQAEKKRKSTTKNHSFIGPTVR